MRNIEIQLSADIDLANVETAIDRSLHELGLTVNLRGTLKKLPGCVHWHARQSRESGTLEITLWPPEHGNPGTTWAWFSVQDGRQADWIDAKIDALRTAIQQESKAIAR